MKKIFIPVDIDLSLPNSLPVETMHTLQRTRLKAPITSTSYSVANSCEFLSHYFNFGYHIFLL